MPTQQNLEFYLPGVPPALHQAQLTIAREKGFASWMP